MNAENFVRKVVPETGGIIGSYVVVAEVIHEDRSELQVSVAEGTAPWSALGMLQIGADMLVSAQYEEEIEED